MAGIMCQANQLELQSESSSWLSKYSAPSKRVIEKK